MESIGDANVQAGRRMMMMIVPSFIASMAYSTWNSRPSGLKVLTPRSYSERVRNMAVYEKEHGGVQSRIGHRAWLDHDEGAPLEDRYARHGERK